MALQLLIVDDEPLARLRLRTLVQELQGPSIEYPRGQQDASGSAPAPSPRWQVAGEAGSADEALRWLQQQPVDALLLDIRMPGRNGLELAHALRQLPRPPAVVLVTAHAEHAVRAFELNAVDYLTKPVRRERLAEALQRLANRVQQLPLPGATAAEAAPAAATAHAVPEAASAVLVITERDRIVRLPVAELWYCRAEQKQVLLRAASGSYLVDDSLAELEEKLARQGGHFIRVHRNALVALAAMRQLELRTEFTPGRPEGSEGWAVRVAPLDEWLSVSRRQVAAVKAALAAGGQVALQG